MHQSYLDFSQFASPQAFFAQFECAPLSSIIWRGVSTCPGYLRDPFLSELYMPRVRTNFPLSLFSFRAECIVVGRVDFVTFCLQKLHCLSRNLTVRSTRTT